jgi:hypothetical protein
MTVPSPVTHNDPASGTFLPAADHDARRQPGLLERDLDRPGAVDRLGALPGQGEPPEILRHEEEQRRRWRIDVAADRANVEARALVGDPSGLADTGRLAGQQRGEAVLAVLHRLAVDLDHIAESRPPASGQPDDGKFGDEVDGTDHISSTGDGDPLRIGLTATTTDAFSP